MLYLINNQEAVNIDRIVRMVWDDEGHEGTMRLSVWFAGVRDPVVYRNQAAADFWDTIIFGSQQAKYSNGKAGA